MKLNFIKAVACICLAVFLLSACTHGNKFDISSGSYLDKKTGVEYKAASWEYEAMSVSDDIYGEYKKKYDLEFHRIGDIDPKLLLTDAVGTVYYTSEVALPTLENSDSVVYADVYNAYDELVATVNGRTDIELIIDTFTKGYNAYESMYFESAEPAVNVNQRIKFAFSELGVYYVLAYVEYAEDFSYYDANGKERSANKVIFNRYTKTYVPVEDSLTSLYAVAE